MIKAYVMVFLNDLVASFKLYLLPVVPVKAQPERK